MAVKASELFCPVVTLLVRAGSLSFTAEAMPDKWPEVVPTLRAIEQFGHMGRPPRSAFEMVGGMSLLTGDALTHGVCHCLTSWRVTEGGAPLPVNRATVNRLPEGARAAILRAVARAYDNPADRDEGAEEMSVDINALTENYYDEATVKVKQRTPEGLKDVTLTVAHRAIDSALWSELLALEDADDGTPVGALQLARLDATVREIEGADFTAAWWAGLHPRLCERVVVAVSQNVPAAVAFAVRRGEEKEAEPQADEETEGADV